ncbi:hypothetical protein F3Y22_tig00000340pilonHSYRG00392 [Hibiscus syriacus]|uniref:Uncharacterized protein n=1 Tax=Hibiscus syriacus TaxID=106335 RepID=A0A6A3D472_HIBSY|nr:hypothetical protein F3Y22_tig00000340pilonHSYRG00392 [Hibiscus syriacus]
MGTTSYARFLKSMSKKKSSASSSSSAFAAKDYYHASQASFEFHTSYHTSNMIQPTWVGHSWDTIQHTSKVHEDSGQGEWDHFVYSQQSRQVESVTAMMASNTINSSPYFEGASKSVLSTPQFFQQPTQDAADEDDDDNDQGGRPRRLIVEVTQIRCFLQHENNLAFAFNSLEFSVVISFNYYAPLLVVFSMKTMKPGVSSLNPYAASYIPLAKRVANDNVVDARFYPSLGRDRPHSSPMDNIYMHKKIAV